MNSYPKDLKNKRHASIPIKLALLLILAKPFATEILKPTTIQKHDSNQICLDTPLSNSLIPEESDEDPPKEETFQINPSKKSKLLSYHTQTLIKPHKKQKPKKPRKKCYSLSNDTREFEHIRFHFKKKTHRRFGSPVCFNNYDNIFSIKHDFNYVFSNHKISKEIIKKQGITLVSEQYHATNFCPICHKKFSNSHYRNFHLFLKHVNISLLPYDYNILSFIEYQTRRERRLYAQLGIDFDSEDELLICREIVTSFSKLHFSCERFFESKKEIIDSETIPVVVIVCIVFVFLLVLVFLSYGIYIVTNDEY